MAVPGELHWERLSTGLYQTAFYANGYRYRITKHEYYSTPEWKISYRWHNSSSKNWKPMSGSPSNTLKDAKQRCFHHNLRPRRKFKFLGRVTEDTNDIPTYTKQTHMGKLIYGEVLKDGSFSKFYRDYKDPEEFFNPKKAEENE